jgi:hypothetical protein
MRDDSYIEAFSLIILSQAALKLLGFIEKVSVQSAPKVSLARRIATAELSQ